MDVLGLCELLVLRWLLACYFLVVMLGVRILLSVPARVRGCVLLCLCPRGDATFVPVPMCWVCWGLMAGRLCLSRVAPAVSTSGAAPGRKVAAEVSGGMDAASVCAVTALPCSPPRHRRPLCKCLVGPVTTDHAVLSGLLSSATAWPHTRKGRRQQEMWRAPSLDMGRVQAPAPWKQQPGALG